MTDTNQPAPIPQDDDTAWPEHDDADLTRNDSEEREKDAAIDRDTAVIGSPD